ncbi:hypothetical protein OAQ74_00955 [Gammaproteobacteria bacterium]|nr:hypothetical protein [Gammaproteobacteria bacterium]
MRNYLVLAMTLIIVGCAPDWENSGFSSEEDWLSAKASGFFDESELFYRASKFGIETYDEWIKLIDDSKDKGYVNFYEYLELRNDRFLECSDGMEPGEKGFPTTRFLRIGTFELTSRGYLIGFISFETLRTRNDVVKIVGGGNGYASYLEEPYIIKEYKAQKEEARYLFWSSTERSSTRHSLDRETLKLTSKTSFGSNLYSTDSYDCKLSSADEYVRKRKEMVSEQLKNNKKKFNNQQKLLEDNKI